MPLAHFGQALGKRPWVAAVCPGRVRALGCVPYAVEFARGALGPAGHRADALAGVAALLGLTALLGVAAFALSCNLCGLLLAARADATRGA